MVVSLRFSEVCNGIASAGDFGVIGACMMSLSSGFFDFEGYVSLDCWLDLGNVARLTGGRIVFWVVWDWIPITDIVKVDCLW